MGSYADATAELARISRIPGCVARRDPVSINGNAGVTDNRIMVKDARVSGRRVAIGSSVISTPNDPGLGTPTGQNSDGTHALGWHSWMIFEVGGEVAYWQSTNIAFS